MFREASTHVPLWNLDNNIKDQEKLSSSRNVVLPQNSPDSMDSAPS